MESKANLFIVGAAKCGTTSLYEYLSQHPEIYMSPVKEPHYFASNVENVNKELWKAPIKGQKYHTKIVRDPKIYSSLFEDGSKHKIRGEASPSYLWDRDAARKIYDYNKDAKIIILLRDPIKRLISQYQMAIALGTHEQEPFLPFIKKEFEKERKVWGIDHIYIDLGFYYQQISKYAEIFPSNQIKIIKFDDLVNEKKEVLKNLCYFLDVNPSCVDELKLDETHNVTSHPKYNFLRVFKKNRMIKALVKSMGTKKELLKAVLYTKGYSDKLTIDDFAVDFLETIYKDDLLRLKAEYRIEF